MNTFFSDIRSKLRRSKAMFFLRTVGNTLGLMTNLKWWIYHLNCRLNSRQLIKGHSDLAKEIHHQGFTRLPQQDVSELSQIVSKHFKENPFDSGNSFLPKDVAERLAPGLFELFKPGTILGKTLTSYFGSHYAPYWIHSTRYQTGESIVDVDAFKWHTDDNPKQVIKVFIYLKDTREDNAAFRAFNYKVSQDLFRKGFVSFTPDTRLQSQKLITDELAKQHLNIFEGPAGTVLVFDNNLVHKATQPTRDAREMITVELLPSDRPISKEQILNAVRSPRTVDYPQNPFQFKESLA